MEDELDDCCMCGGSLDTPWDCYANGHSPLSMNAYYKRDDFKPTKKETKTMNYSTAVMLINENIRAVNVTYEPDEHSCQTAKRTMYKTLDTSLEVGDLVVVPTDTRHRFTIARIDAVDVEVDFESSTQVDWIAGNAPIESYNDILQKEGEMISVVKASEKRAKREEIKKNMIGLQEENKLETLAIANMGGAAAIEEDTEEE